MWWPVLLCLLTDSTAIYDVRVAPDETLHVAVAGTGDPVLLLPGLLGGAYGFRKLTTFLVAHGHQVIVVEPLGIGASSRPVGADYSLDAQTARVTAVLDSLGVVQATVVAHSVGAGIGFRLAYRRPELVRALVSLDGGPVERAATAGLRHAAQWAPWVKTFGGVTLVRRKVRESLVKSSGDPSWVTDDAVEAYTADAARDIDGTLKAYIRMSESRERGKLAPHLSDIHCPVLLLLGGSSHAEAPTAREIELLRASVPTLVVDSIAGAGHYLQEERPELVGEALERVARLTLAGAAQ